jgi:hypothetical protein
MALDLKNTFDKTFTNYKENLSQFQQFIGDEEKPKFSKNIEGVVENFFDKIKNRLNFLEDTVLKQIDEKTELKEMESSV